MSEMDNFMIETELIKNDCKEFKKNEDNLHLEIDSASFYQILEDDYGYDYKTISRYIEGGVYSLNEQHEFNIVLRKLKRDHNIEITDSILFLEDSILMNNILKFIDDETEWTLKDELAKKYNINKKNNNIFELLYWLFGKKCVYYTCWIFNSKFIFF